MLSLVMCGLGGAEKTERMTWAMPLSGLLKGPLPVTGVSYCPSAKTPRTSRHLVWKLHPSQQTSFFVAEMDTLSALVCMGNM